MQSKPQSKPWGITLFLFRRDLRLEDNTGLLFALRQSRAVVPAFIFTPEQIENNPLRSDRCVQFMLESLEDLDQALKAKGARLFFFHGKVQEVTSHLIDTLGIEAVVVNKDYTPYSRKRDAQLEQLCQKKGISFHSFHDALLHPPEETLKKEGTPYTVFTPYFRNASKHEICEPEHNRFSNYFNDPIALSAKGSELPKLNITNPIQGGRTAALKLLKHLGSLTEYAQQRDFPAEKGTSCLSAYLKFNVVSVREVHAAIVCELGTDHPLIRSLYWRDFFTAIALFFPYVFEGAFHPKFNQLKWSSDRQAFERWCQGTTGFPIVDAAMRELNATGLMHNRARMIAASFLVKDLQIDWRWGEHYFAKNLIDYDPAVNNGNWQWVASTGCDAQPYFRIFNPWSQQKKFDPDCVYIKEWIPELRAIPPDTLHSWYEKASHSYCPRYPAPMLEHSSAAQEALNRYRSIGAS